MSLSMDFIRKVARSLHEEEIDVYVLNLYYRDSEEMKFFNEKDRHRVKKIFDILINDTKRHAELLQLIIDLSSP